MAERTGFEPATPGVTGRYSNQLNYRSANWFFHNAARSTMSKFKPGDDLLSHGETPHYHRRYFVSLLSSAWDQVGPKCYGRQANSFCYRPKAITIIWKAVFVAIKAVLTHSSTHIESVTKPFWCCMVKPHGRLVQVSSTPHNAYTPCLSTF